MSLINRLKLAKMILKFGSIQTDNGELQYEGELGTGLDVFVESEGDLIPAPDGEYKSEDKTIVVEGGKIKEIVEVAEEDPNGEETSQDENLEDENKSEEGEEAPQDDPKDKEIEDLKKQLEEKDKEIEDLKKQLDEATQKLSMSVEKPAHVEIKDTEIKNKTNKAMKYFA